MGYCHRSVHVTAFFRFVKLGCDLCMPSWLERITVYHAQAIDGQQNEFRCEAWVRQQPRVAADQGTLGAFMARPPLAPLPLRPPRAPQLQKGTLHKQQPPAQLWTDRPLQRTDQRPPAPQPPPGSHQVLHDPVNPAPLGHLGPEAQKRKADVQLQPSDVASRPRGSGT